MSTVIRFKRGTLAQLVAAAGAAGLREGEPYHITDLDMNAIGLSTTTYRFDGVLQLDGSEAVPTGYIGAVSRPGALATVAGTGDYNDLNNRPSLAAVATSGAYSDLSGRPTLAAVATSGAYSDLSGTPTIVALTNSTPAGLGTAAVGTSSDAARADHVHAKSSVYTYGTAAPSGGADGDLYIQHT
jgi:hypothetical protein